MNHLSASTSNPKSCRKNIQQTIANKVIEAFADLGVTQTQKIAEILDISPSQVSQMRKGKAIKLTNKAIDFLTSASALNKKKANFTIVKVFKKEHFYDNFTPKMIETPKSIDKKLEEIRKELNNIYKQIVQLAKSQAEIISFLLNKIE